MTNISSQRTNDVYQLVTDTIIQQLETGTIPWQKPWVNNSGGSMQLPQNFATGNYYRGINIVLLWSSAMKNKYPHHEWASFKQWNSQDEMVRKGEKGNLVVYYDKFEKEIDGELTHIPFLKASYVFNKAQLLSFDASNLTPQPSNEQQPLVERIGVVDEFLANTGAIIEQHDDDAFYQISNDKILLPYTEKFHDTISCTATEGFYSTCFHELSHWTGASHRLNRTYGKRFGDPDYAKEELLAEFGAAFLCAGFGLANLDKGDHAGYIENWLKVLKEDKKLLVAAASGASKAVEYLHSLQPKG